MDKRYAFHRALNGVWDPDINAGITTIIFNIFHKVVLDIVQYCSSTQKESPVE